MMMLAISLHPSNNLDDFIVVVVAGVASVPNNVDEFDL